MDAILTKYFGANPTAQPNSVEQNFRTHCEAVMQILSSQITNLKMKIEEEMKINQALREAEKVRPPISELSLSELQSMKHNIDMLRSHVVQKLMKVHAQAKIAQMGSGSFFGYSQFGANDDVGLSGGASAL
nr:agamous-like MADS-box protein AGL61 [Ipomoea batatas]